MSFLTNLIWMPARHVHSGLCTCLAAEIASSAVAATRSSSTSSRSQTPTPKLDATTRRLEELLGSIPLDLLAQAAAHCGAHARALQYYEGFARAAYKGGLNPSAASAVTYDSKAVTFLQASGIRAQRAPGSEALLSLLSPVGY